MLVVKVGGSTDGRGWMPIDDLEDEAAGLQAARDRAKAALVIHLVALATGVAPREITRDTRARSEAARARWLAIYLTHVAFALPLVRAAAAFGRDRSTVSHVVQRVEDWRDDADFDGALSALEACLTAAPLEFAPGALAPESRRRA